ncbi:MAG: hypothetical protein GX434_00250 [Peptococcaceae bacterium]|nr:hypothetical protein [Peptococcaceae bacterium]
MTEILTTVAYVGGGLALGFLVELPFCNAVATAREKYGKVLGKLNDSDL